MKEPDHSGRGGRHGRPTPACRILIVVENLPVPLDRRVWQEACALRDAGHTVTIICPRMHGYSQPFEVLDGITIYRHWIATEGNGLLGFICEYGSALWGELVCAVRAWGRTGFDIVHLCNPPDVLFLVALPFKLLAGVRVVYDVHDLWPEMFEAKFGSRGPIYWCVRLAQRCTLRLADSVLVTNLSTRAAVQQHGARADDEVFVVRTAPATLNTAASPDPALKQDKRYLVGYVGVMGDADGVEYLLEAAHHIVHIRGRGDVRFLLMGSGPEHATLLERRDALGLQEHVGMPGRVSNDFLFAALATMDLGVACDPINPYNDKCTMNKTLEYMAFGKPQVMFGTREGRHSAGEAARYVMENSAVKLGDAIIELLDDPGARERMGHIGQQRLATDLNWEKSVAELLRAYEHAANTRP